MPYESTRGQSPLVSSASAIKMGIAPDGGLFVPKDKVQLRPGQLDEMLNQDYRQIAQSILELFLTDFSRPELENCVFNTYNALKFDTPDIAPTIKLNDHTYFLELWHGPTCAFKDMALQLLPHLLTTSLKKTGEKAEIVILVATSGDTGKAALEGFRDVPGTKIIVFYPDQGVSEIQKRQMVTQEGNNVAVMAVLGNFDDAQNGVKNIFGDHAFNEALLARQIKLSSANSINWGRLVPQIIYYVSTYLDLLRQQAITPGEAINVVVPTGNFGNILAAFYARQMGLPIQRLICAANANKVLTDFIRTGVYDRNRAFEKTISPSMDILISSNLERLLYELTEHDAGRIRTWMNQLKDTGRYQVDDRLRQSIQDLFWSDFAPDTETMTTIKETYQQYGYVLDPHTAVGKKVYDKYVAATGDRTLTVIASTASPFKFSASVIEAILGPEAIKGQDEYALLELLSTTCQIEIPEGLKNLKQKPIRHTARTERTEMKKAVKKLLQV
ncbi:MAG: threonine synthase [Syntrophomonadaceae bacterium]|nr:threonine synthase [Syntrophomonadaceae bacterium]